MILIYILLFLIMAFTWSSRYHVYTKGLCSFGFLLTAFLGTLSTHHMNLFFIALPGFLSFLIGDILLGLKNRFKYGLYAFLIGDIAFLFFYYHFQSFTLLELIIPILLMILLEIITYYHVIEIDEYKTEITSYVFAIGWVTTKSLLTALHMGTAAFQMMAAGFILYFISDSLLLELKFGSKHFKKLGAVNLFLYYFGLFLIAYSFSLF